MHLQIADTGDVLQIRELASDLFMECGIMKSTSTLGLNDKVDIVYSWFNGGDYSNS